MSIAMSTALFFASFLILVAEISAQSAHVMDTVFYMNTSEVETQFVEKGRSARSDVVYYYTWWGIWGDFEEWFFCPPKTYVTGLSILVEKYQGYCASSGCDDSSVNGIRILCQDRDRSIYKWIWSKRSPWGSFERWVERWYNNHAMVSFQLMWEPNQGSGDDVAVNGIDVIFGRWDRARDYNLAGFSRHKLIGHANWGNWQTVFVCPEYSHVCGMRTQHENPHPGDESALNGVGVACCKGFQ